METYQRMSNGSDCATVCGNARSSGFSQGPWGQEERLTMLIGKNDNVLPIVHKPKFNRGLKWSIEWEFRSVLQSESPSCQFSKLNPSFSQGTALKN